MPSPSDENLRNCPGCGKPFSADPGRISQCPACGRLVLFDDLHRRVAFERGDLNADDQPSVSSRTQLADSQPEPKNKEPSAFIGPLLTSQFARWQPYQAALERQLIDVWPARLLTFTKHERWALRASQRGQFGFTQLLDPRLARYLAAGPAPVRLNSLESLSLPIARQLARSRSSLHLRAVSRLDIPTATALANHRGETLALDGLTSLTDEMAATLARHQGEGLSLDGISRIEPSIAAVLAEYRGRLALNGLSSLTPAVATQLADHRGNALSLAGIRQLAPETAMALAGYEGDLYLEGLDDLTGELARAFHDFTGKLQLRFHEIRRKKRRQVQREETGNPFSLVFLVAVAAVFVIAGYELLELLADLISNP